MLLVPSWPDFPAGAAVKNLAALERNVQVKICEYDKLPKVSPLRIRSSTVHPLLFLVSAGLHVTDAPPRPPSMRPCYTLRLMCRTVLSSSLASSSSGSVVTEGVLGLYQDICSMRPLKLAPWLAAWKTKTNNTVQRYSGSFDVPVQKNQNNQWDWWDWVT